MFGWRTSIRVMFAVYALGIALPQTWTMAIGGDVMLDRIPIASRPFAKIAPILKSASVAIVNLEVPLTSIDNPTKRKTAEDIRRKRQFVLRANTDHVRGMMDAGIDLVSLANNHIMDHGAAGLAECRAYLEAVGIKYAGAESNLAGAERPAIFQVRNGPKVAFISFLSFMSDTSNWKCTPATQNSAGLAALVFGGSVDSADRAVVARHVARAKKAGDFVVVAIHWGIEKTTVPTPYQVSLGRAFIDAGADIVIGHHPHVLQGAELYRGKPIFYSLGNLVSRMSFDSAVFTLTFNGTFFQSVKVHPVSMVAGVPVPKSKPLASVTAFRKLVSAIQTKFQHAGSAPLGRAIKD